MSLARRQPDAEPRHRVLLGGGTRHRAGAARLAAGREADRAPGIAQHVGAFTAPVHLSVRMNIAVVLVTLAAGTERALRLRNSRLLDGGAG